MSGHGLVEVGDAGAFLARLTRLDPAAVVRLRPADRAGPGEARRTALWGRLPWGVLVTREVPGTGSDDVTVSAADLLAVLTRGGGELPARRDDRWRWPLPPAGLRPVETVTAGELAKLAAAVAGTLREVTAGGLGGRAVGQRAVRDALLDHVALVVTTADGRRVEVPQRLVQAVSRMGFLGPSGMDRAQVRVYASNSWVGISAPYGVTWLPTASKLTVMPIGNHPKR